MSDVLTPRQRQIADLANAGHASGEIAELLRMKPQNVWNTLSTARKRIAVGTLPSTAQKRAQDEARAVDARLEANGRCQHPMRKGPCGLLLPCWDHA